MYNNEREAGKAIRDFLASPDEKNPEDAEGPRAAAAALTREDIHYTTKLASCSTNYHAVRRSIKQSVEVCGLGYVDLMLLHSPYGGKEARLTSWKALEDAIEAGEVRMGGVSNYGVRHVSLLLSLRRGREDGQQQREHRSDNKHALSSQTPPGAGVVQCVTDTNGLTELFFCFFWCRSRS